MSARIRYTKTSQEGLLQSVRKFQHPTNALATYKVFLNLKDNQWLVVDDKTDQTVASGRNTNHQKLKLEVKKALKDLGIAFSEENRAERKAKDHLNDDARRVYESENALDNDEVA